MLDPAEARGVLARTPAVVSALLDGLPDAWLDANEGAGTFSSREVLGHLIHGEETDWVPRIRIILEHGEGRPFTPFDRFGFRKWIHGVPIQALLERFASLRAQNVAVLDSLKLDPATLARTGAQPELRPLTLAQLLASLVVHDIGHLAQISRVLAKRYGGGGGARRGGLALLDRRAAPRRCGGEVGRWREYSPILDR